jgi:hypothetical protein
MEISQPTVSRRIDSGVTQLRQGLRTRGILVAAGALGSLLVQNAAQAAPAAVLKELGKIAIVGTAATSTAGTSAAVSATSKVAAGVAAGIKAKVITATAIAAVGIGGVATYKHVSTPKPTPQTQTKQKASAPIEKHGRFPLLINHKTHPKISSNPQETVAVCTGEDQPDNKHKNSQKIQMIPKTEKQELGGPGLDVGGKS